MTDLFDRAARYPNAPGYARCSDTSKAAADSMRPHMNRLQLKVLAFITKRGAVGATYTEIMDACDLGAPTTAGRLRELALMEQIEDSGERRRTPSERTARVYRVRVRA